MKQLIIAARVTLVFAVLTGVAYPLLVTGLSKAIFPHQSNGSLVQAGGKTILMMAAALSPGFVASQGYAGIFLGFFDSGASLLDGAHVLIDSGIMAAFAGGSDNASIVRFLYANVYGQAPDAATLANILAPLNANTTSQSQWMADLAASQANQTHVNLVGYAGTGLQYTVS